MATLTAQLVSLDNCPLRSNPGQEAKDFDGLGDLCEELDFFTDPNDADTDDDGCLDGAELEPKSLAALGGGRDPLFFWDFFDTWATGSRTGNIDGFDIGDVVLRFDTALGTPPTKEEALAEALAPPTDTTSYHAASDRDSPDPEANVWNLRPPNGIIDGFDISFVVVQFGHNCA